MSTDDWFLRTFANGISETWCITWMAHIAIIYMAMDALGIEND